MNETLAYNELPVTYEISYITLGDKTITEIVTVKNEKVGFYTTYPVVKFLTEKEVNERRKHRN